MCVCVCLFRTSKGLFCLWQSLCWFLNVWSVQQRCFSGEYIDDIDAGLLKSVASEPWASTSLMFHMVVRHRCCSGWHFYFVCVPARAQTSTNYLTLRIYMCEWSKPFSVRAAFNKAPLKCALPEPVACYYSSPCLIHCHPEHVIPAGVWKIQF